MNSFLTVVISKEQNEFLFDENLVAIFIHRFICIIAHFVLGLNGKIADKKLRNFKLTVDPALKQGPQKVYRFDGHVPGVSTKAN